MRLGFIAVAALLSCQDVVSAWGVEDWRVVNAHEPNPHQRLRAYDNRGRQEAYWRAESVDARPHQNSYWKAGSVNAHHDSFLSKTAKGFAESVASVWTTVKVTATKLTHSEVPSPKLQKTYRPAIHYTFDEPSFIVKRAIKDINKLTAKVETAKEDAKAIADAADPSEPTQKVGDAVRSLSAKLKLFSMMLKLTGSLHAPESDSLEIAMALNKFSISFGELVGILINDKTVAAIKKSDADKDLMEAFGLFREGLEALKTKGLELLTGQGRDMAKNDFEAAEVALDWLEEEFRSDNAYGI